MLAHSGVKHFIATIICVFCVNTILPQARADSDEVLSPAILSGNTVLDLDTSMVPVDRYAPTIRLRDEKLAGFRSIKATGELRIRGWEIRDNVYFGQTKVGGRWGPGILIERDSYVYGINHRGIQILKRF